MIFKLFARKTEDAVTTRLYAEIMAAARRPELFLDRYAAPDTMEGRFDLFVLHAFVALRRLSALPEPGPQMAQALTDRIFTELDRALREMGVGDLAVPKRMKKLGADYNGRFATYAATFGEGEDALAAALARNVYGSEDAETARALTRYALAAERAFADAPLSLFERGPLKFPDPAGIA